MLMIHFYREMDILNKEIFFAGDLPAYGFGICRVLLTIRHPCRTKSRTTG